jgi:hypothetical protein
MLWSGKQVGELLTLESAGTINGGRDWCRRYVDSIAAEVFETDQSCSYMLAGTTAAAEVPTVTICAAIKSDENIIRNGIRIVLRRQ